VVPWRTNATVASASISGAGTVIGLPPFLANESILPTGRPADPEASMRACGWRLTPSRSIREIAGELVVSVRTVENHLQRVYEKLGVSGRKELAVTFRGAD
jgi:hypothetical protein